MAAREAERFILLAIDLIERAMDAHISNARDEFELEVWKASSETEYATFLLSRFRAGNDDSWKKETEKIDRSGFGLALTSAQELLREAASSLVSDLEVAYEKTWKARGHLLTIQEALEREKIVEARARSERSASP